MGQGSTLCGTNSIQKKLPTPSHNPAGDGVCGGRTWDAENAETSPLAPVVNGGKNGTVNGVGQYSVWNKQHPKKTPDSFA